MSTELAKKIVEKTGELMVKDAHFTQFTRDLVSNLKEKQQKVIQKRFGLAGRKKTTLDAIGKEFGVTRERIRQIESASLGKLKKLSKLDHNVAIFQKIRSIIEANGGIIDEKTLVDNLIFDLEAHREEEIKKMLRFILLLDDEVNVIEEGDNTGHGWSLARHNKGVVSEIINIYVSILEVKQEVLTDEMILNEILSHELFTTNHKDNIDERFLKSSLNLAKKIHVTEDGKRGLTTWPWVKPKTIKDKIFFILSKKGEPMHFTDIFNEIQGASFDKKSATLQTIHNELISDKRFVLVGRGLYGLKDWGFEAGTVEEVIEKILSKNAPLAQHDVVEEVMKKKKVKKATILINLQNSPRFKKTEEGYILNV